MDVTSNQLHSGDVSQSFSILTMVDEEKASRSLSVAEPSPQKLLDRSSIAKRKRDSLLLSVFGANGASHHSHAKAASMNAVNTLHMHDPREYVNPMQRASSVSYWTILSIGNNLTNFDDSLVRPLLVIGQGTIEVRQSHPTPFQLIVYNSTNGEQSANLTLKVTGQQVSLTFKANAHSKTINLGQTTERTSTLQTEGVAQCAYWLSISSEHQFIKYGIGELRERLVEMQHVIADDAKKNSELAHLLESVDRVRLQLNVTDGNAGFVNAAVLSMQDMWRVHLHPVVGDPPMLVVKCDEMTMDMVHAEQVTVAENLPPACQRLYYNVCGEEFKLNTIDFPYLTKAIEESIRDENGWCYKTLQHKASEFGKHDVKATYLRITLGEHHCNSPGIPYVVEIWPPGHYSPVHNHGYSHAIIRVLHGEINVSLYAFLSPFCDAPFEQVNFKKGDITYLTEGVNQTHKLQNMSEETTCITIQCYQYGDDDQVHYEFFDYVSNQDINTFEPNSDMPFSEFKQLMKDEYHQKRVQKRFRIGRYAQKCCVIFCFLLWVVAVAVAIAVI